MKMNLMLALLVALSAIPVSATDEPIKYASQPILGKDGHGTWKSDLTKENKNDGNDKDKNTKTCGM